MSGRSNGTAALANPQNGQRSTDRSMGKFPRALEHDSHAVTGGYPGPRSATWLRQLTHSLGIVTAERGIAGATRYPSAQTAGNSRNAVKEPHIKRPTQDPFRSLGRQWAHRHQSNNLWPVSWRSHRTHIRAQAISGPKDCSRERSQPHPKWASFWGTTRGEGPLVLEQAETHLRLS